MVGCIALKLKPVVIQVGAFLQSSLSSFQEEGLWQVLCWKPLSKKSVCNLKGKEKETHPNQTNPTKQKPI